MTVLVRRLLQLPAVTFLAAFCGMAPVPGGFLWHGNGTWLFISAAMVSTPTH